MWKEDMIMRLIFRELFIFSPSEKKAKKVEFTDGINIITSSQEEAFIILWEQKVVLKKIGKARIKYMY